MWANLSRTREAVEWLCVYPTLALEFGKRNADHVPNLAIYFVVAFVIAWDWWVQSGEVRSFMNQNRGEMQLTIQPVAFAR